MSTSKILSPGEIAVGQFITVLEWLSREIPADPFGGLFGGSPIVTQHKDHSWCGDILKVEAVDLPYIVVRETYEKAKPFNIDTRELKLMELSKEYVKAMTKS